MTKRKLIEQKLQQRQQKARQQRIVTFIVLIFSLFLTLFFWWQGELHLKFQNSNQSTDILWKKQQSEKTKLKKINTNDLKTQIIDSVKGLQGTYVIYGKNLLNNREKLKRNSWELSVGEINKPMQAASLIKLPVIIAAYRLDQQNKFNLNATYQLQDKDRVGGSGSLINKETGYQISWKKLIWHMGNESDNTAFAALVNYLGQDQLEQEFVKMGLLNTSISNNQTTTREIAKIFEKLYHYQWFSKTKSETIITSMINTWYEDRIPAGIPPLIRVSHKVGTETGVISDAGIIYSDQGAYLLIIMTENVNTTEAKKVLPDISQTVWNWQKNLTKQTSLLIY